MPPSSRTDEPLDTTVRLVTPERITFAYPLAGPFHRALAYLIDSLIVAGLIMVALIGSLIVALGSTAGLGLGFIFMFLIEWGYWAFCEGVFNGQTIGKKALNLRVVSDQGVPITGAQAVLRNLLRVAEGVPFGYLPALASMVLTRKFQRLGDLVARTIVVVEEVPARVGVVRVDDPEVEAVLLGLPSRMSAGPELARALSDYVVRRKRFGRSRREEMTEDLARPLRERYRLPNDASADAVVCATYRRVFLGE